MRAVVRNTFLDFEEDGDQQLLGRTPMMRSKSVGDDPEVAADAEEAGEQGDLRVRGLTRLLREGPASWGPLAAPPPAAPAARGEAESQEAACRGLPKVTSNASVSTMVPEDADAARGAAGHPLRSVGSCNSINSMLSDWAGPSLRNVGSSGSVSSMVSETARADEGPGEALGVAGAGWHAPGPRRGRGRQAGQVLSSPPAPKDYCHGQVPKRCDLAKEFECAAQQGPPTTMMIRNIPNHYTQASMVRELEGLGFQGSYDFLYVPIDKGTMGSVGYCFVNFVTPEWASHCARTFDGRPFSRQSRDKRGKVATVSVAHLQGLEANLRHYRNSAVAGVGQHGKHKGPMVIASLSRALG